MEWRKKKKSRCNENVNRKKVLYRIAIMYWDTKLITIKRHIMMTYIQ